jgi:hypothetical protein
VSDSSEIPSQAGPAQDAPPGSRTVRAPGPGSIGGLGSDGFDPYAKLFQADGRIDQDYSTKRVPTLVGLLRHHPLCFELRVDVDDLQRRLLEDDAEGLRSADDEEAFEANLAAFSRAHLHELIEEELLTEANAALRQLSQDIERTRRQRVAAALGVALLATPPDANGMAGRPLIDLVFRISLEELHASEQLREKARTTEGGVGIEELQEFWTTYPALRHRYEVRYKRELQRVVMAVEAGEFPQAISVDLALRGAATLLTAVTAARAAGETIDADAAQTLLRDPFEQDMLDDGREVVLGRWAAAAEEVEGASADDRREFVRLIETAIRLVREGGPAADLLIFYSYLRALVDGHFYVQDSDEAAAARGMFHDEGLSCDALLRFIDYHAERGNTGTHHRLVLAATELWPEDEQVRERAQALGESEMATAQGEDQGPFFLPEADSETAAAAKAPEVGSEGEQPA